MKSAPSNEHIFGRDDRPVFAIIIYSFAFSFAAMVASLEMLRRTASGYSFHPSWRTAVIFALGGTVFIPCFKAIFLARGKIRRFAALALLALIGLGSFLYPLRFVPVEKFGDIFTGLAFAAFFLSGIGGMLYGVHRFCRADERQAEEEG